jgi:SRSO17 transposase
MTPRQLEKLDQELSTFLAEMTDGQGRPERRAALAQYITGLLLDGERKSIQPMAMRLIKEPSQADAMRQRLQDCVSASRWSEKELLRRFALKMDRELPGLEALVVDDTGFAKKGTHSVGVARQYSGTFGGTDNGQVAPSLHLAGEQGSVMVGMRVYLPKEWTDDRARCRRVGVPDEVRFTPKWQIALDLIDQALAFGVRRHPALADAGFGSITAFRDGLTERGLTYVVGVANNHLIWPPETKLQPPAPRTGRPGRPAVRWHAGDAKPVRISALVKGIARDKYKTVSWREGARGTLTSKFLAYRVRPAEKETQGRRHGNELWLLCEWQACDAAPQFYFSTLPATTSLKELVRVTKLRWRVERDYQDLKGEVGLDHFEGRTWQGFHRHAALCAVAHGFIALRRALFPPPDALDAPGGTSSPPDPAAVTHRMVPDVHAPDPEAAPCARRFARSL